MFCPVDGDEFVEGITRCPEHHVELVEEPPELEESLSWIDRFNDRTGVRIAFLVFVIAAVVYALSGFTTALIYLTSELQDERTFETAQIFQEVQSATFPVAIATLGILAGALLLRGYLLMDKRASMRIGPDQAIEEQEGEGPISPGLMRVFFTLTVMFALLWAATGIATSKEQAEYSTPFGVGSDEEPIDTFILLVALNHGAYTGGVTCLAIMGAGLIARTHRRGQNRSKDSSQDE